MKTILATTSSFGLSSPEAAARIRALGYTLATNPFGRKLSEEELVGLLAEHRPVGLLAGTEPVSGRAIRGAAEHLKVISRIGVGWDNVDHEAAQALGIHVLRTEGVLDEAVAELTLGFMLDALRHVSLQNAELKSGSWNKRMGRLLQGKTVGIIGFGAIGQRVAELCRAFGANVLCTDIREVDHSLAKRLPLMELLPLADIVTIHASGGDLLLDMAALDACKPGMIVCNTARGGQIDETALAERLEDGHIGYACLDVFEREPYTGPLAGLNNTVLTPHVGSYASEARVAMELMAVDNLLHGLGE